jgi:membrane-associated phospholipid phosphatase
MRVFSLDRRLGQAIRHWVIRLPGGAISADGAARALSPAFHLAVAVAIAHRPSRATGLRMLASGVAAALAARALRNRIGRSRPGGRAEGGFPSRHAAAAVAIAVAARRRPGLAHLLWPIAVAGLLGRVASGEHEPADIAAGGGLGLVTAQIVDFLARGERVR